MTSPNATEVSPALTTSCPVCSASFEAGSEICPVCLTSQLGETPVFPRQILDWWRGSASEIAFWDRWHASGGLQWPESFKQRQLATRQFDVNLLRGMVFEDIGSLKLLDVGAGPMTSLGPDYKGTRLNITACDPLAPLYSSLALKYGLTPPVKTVLAFAEDLTVFYEHNSFDFTNCRNALDHTFDPIRCIEEMLLVTKVGGKIHLFHRANEAEKEKYSGLHQWNFDCIEDHFVVWNKNSRIDVTETYRGEHEIKVRKGGDEWLTVEIFKRTEMEIDLAARHRSRLRELSISMISLLSTVSNEVAKPAK
jgi:SAM-dependent methyltransferase